MARLITALTEALPVFDVKAFDAAVAEVKEHPRASLHYLFDQFGAADPAVQAMVCRILLECGSADVNANLNAIIFDAEQDAWSKVLANDLLAKLGNPVEPDVFAMSVDNPKALEEKLASHAAKLLTEGDVETAVERARTLHQADRSLLITDAIRQSAETTMRFIEALARDGEENATAVVAAIGAEKFEPGVPLLTALQDGAGRAMQKLIKKTLFELRREGLAVPQRKSQATFQTSSGDSGEATALYRALMSAPSSSGLVLVVVAYTRPNRRLKVFTVLVSLWKKGIQEAGFRMNMSRSSFERLVALQPGGALALKEASLEACRKMVARGMRVAKEFGAPLPLDFGMGKSLLGDVDEEAAALETPFLCSSCGKALDVETIEKIRVSAPYDNIPVEMRCMDCRKVVKESPTSAE